MLSTANGSTLRMKKVCFPYRYVLVVLLLNGTFSSAFSWIHYGRNIFKPSSTTHLADLLAAFHALQLDPPAWILQAFQPMTSRVAVTSKHVVAGKGLVATQRLEAGEIVALYPMHALGYANGKDPPVVHDLRHSNTSLLSSRMVGTSDLLCFQEEAVYFGVSVGDHSSAEMSTTDYSYTMLDPSGRYVFDVNPHRNLTTNHLFVAQFVNDASAADFTSEGNTSSNMDIALSYLETSLETCNCVMTPLGPPPLLAYVTTKPVEEGDEFLASYGIDYWLGKVPDEDAEHIRHMWDRSTQMQIAQSHYDDAIDVAVELATDRVASERYDRFTKPIEKFIATQIRAARKGRSWWQRVRQWWRQ